MSRHHPVVHHEFVRFSMCGMHSVHPSGCMRLRPSANQTPNGARPDVVATPSTTTPRTGRVGCTNTLNMVSLPHVSLDLSHAVLGGGGLRCRREVSIIDLNLESYRQVEYHISLILLFEWYWTRLIRHRWSGAESVQSQPCMSDMSVEQRKEKKKVIKVIFSFPNPEVVPVCAWEPMHEDDTSARNSNIRESARERCADRTLFLTAEWNSLIAWLGSFTGVLLNPLWRTERDRDSAGVACIVCIALRSMLKRLFRRMPGREIPRSTKLTISLTSDGLSLPWGHAYCSSSLFATMPLF